MIRRFCFISRALCVIGEFLHPHAGSDQLLVRFPQLGQRSSELVRLLSVIGLAVGGSPW